MLGNVYPFVRNHFCADKGQHKRQPHGKEAQTRQHSSQQEVHGTQAQNRENVGSISDEGILRDAENRWDGIDGQRDIRDFNHQQDQKQRRRVELPTAAHEEVLAFVVVRDAQMLACKTKNETFFWVNLFLLHKQHVNAGVHNKCAKYIQHPGKALNQLRAGQNHSPTHHQRTQNAPFQHAVLKACVDRKRAEDHQKKKQVVDAKSLFNQVAGEEFQARLLPGVVQYAQAKQNRKRNPQQAEQPGFAQADLVQALVEYAQVQRDTRQNENVESNPQQGSAHRDARGVLGSRGGPTGI